MKLTWGQLLIGAESPDATTPKLWTFEIDDLVLKRIFPDFENLGPSWESPYAIEKKLGDDKFKLATVDGTLP